MATYSYEKLKNAQEKAERAGDQESATYFQQQAMRMAKFSQGRDSGFVEDVANIGRGVRSGIGTTYDSLRGVAARVTGNEDALQRINKSKEDRAARDVEFAARSPSAFGSGKFLGEVTATLPIGGAGGLVAKGALRGVGKALAGRPLIEGTRKLATAGMVGEGAAVGAALTDEDESIKKQMAVGAGIDVATGTLLSTVSRPAGEFYRRLRNKSKAKQQLTVEETAAKERFDNARKYGGYHLDPLTASATREAHEVYQGLKVGDTGQTILSYEQKRELSIRKKVVQLIKGFGDQNGYKLPGINDPVPGTGEELRNVGNRIAESLTIARMRDEAEYINLYKEFDTLARETKSTGIYTENMKVGLSNLNAKYQGQAYAEMHNNILKDFKRFKLDADDTFARGSNYSPSQPAGVEIRETPRGGREAAPVGAPQAEQAEKFTFQNAESLIQDLNAYWRPDLTGKEKQMLYDYKKLIDDGLDAMLDNMDTALGSEVRVVTEAGRNARRARREYSQDWDTQDLIRNIVRTGEAGINREARTGEDLFDGVDFVLALNSPKMSPRALKTIKAKLLTTKNGADVLNSMRQAPLLEAMHAAIDKTGQETAEDGLVILNQNKFRQVINKIPKKTRYELWGKDFTDNLDKTVRSWADRWNRPTVRGSSNPSGSFIGLLRNLRFLPTGRLRNIGMAGAGFSQGLYDVAGKASREKLANQITDSTVTDMPTQVYDTQISEILSEFESKFRGANGTRYGDMLRTFGRTGVTVDLLNEDSNSYIFPF